MKKVKSKKRRVGRPSAEVSNASYVIRLPEHQVKEVGKDRMRAEIASFWADFYERNRK